MESSEYATITAGSVLESVEQICRAVHIDDDLSLQTAVALVRDALRKARGTPVVDAEACLLRKCLECVCKDAKAALETATSSLVTKCLKHNGFLCKMFENDWYIGEPTWSLTIANAAQLTLLCPFGPGNDAPVFKLETHSADRPLKAWWNSECMLNFVRFASKLECDDWPGVVATRLTCAIAFMVALDKKGYWLPCGVVFEEQISSPKDHPGVIAAIVGKSMPALTAVNLFRVDLPVSTLPSGDVVGGFQDVEAHFLFQKAEIQCDTKKQRVETPGCGYGAFWYTPTAVAMAFEKVNVAMAESVDALYPGGVEPYVLGIVHFIPFSE